MTFNEWFESFRSEHPSDFDTESGADIIAMEWVAEKAWEACAENLGIRENQLTKKGKRS